MINGVLNVYKEAGFTSHDVVAKLRGIVKQKKIGHTGTLDPDATGVLPVCLGNATKLCDLLTDKDKTYEAILKLGITTDTQDTSGTVLSTSSVTATESEIREAVESFIGDYNQIPPMYSALKVNGKKLYELAREGIEVERKARPVKILGITINWINLENHEVSMTVKCSKGTYIRTLCQDIGEKLSCGGCMSNLKRVQVGRFEIRDSLTLGEIETLVKEDRVGEVIIAVDAMFPQYDRVVIKEESTRLINNGNPFTKKDIRTVVCAEVAQDTTIKTDRKVLVYDYEDRFIGIYKEVEQGRYKPEKMFL